MVMLADAIAAGERPSWPEVVAVMQAVVARCQATGAPAPVPAGLGLLPDGAVEWRAADDVVAPVTEAEQVRRLARLLGDLFVGIEVPVPLRHMQQEYAAETAPAPLLAAFAESVDYFARPDGARTVARYVERAEAALRAPERLQVLQELRERARRTSEAQPTVPVSDLDDGPGTAMRVARGAVFLLLLGTGGVGLLGWAFGAPMTTDGGATPVARAALVWVEGLRLLGLVPAVPAEPPSIDPAPTVEAERPVRSAPVEMPQSTPSAGSSVPATVKEASAVQVPPPTVDRLSAALDPRTYGPEDTEVTPPRWTRQQLPSRADVGLSGVESAALELIVLEDGSVSRVSLADGSGRRVPNLMLLSAAKAWTFAAAVREGRPVKFRLRVVLRN